jgi:NitT/TauT family transport system ATP-binding protein
MTTAASRSTAIGTQSAAPVAQSAGVVPALIEVRQLTRTFDGPAGRLNAIEELSFEVRRAEFLAVVGPSGCGKTTVLRILAGLDRPTSGELVTIGEYPTNALVFQGRSVFPWMTVEDNIVYGLKLARVDREMRQERARLLLELIGIARFARSYPHQLSEGMRQRVAIARALAVDPELLLMDEPFSSLDEQTKLLLQDELLRIWEQTRNTIVFVTHSIDEALVLADRVIVMTAQPGRIKAIFDVPLERPRSFLQARSNPVFASLFKEIWSLLRDEVQMARLQLEGGKW